MSQDRNSPNTEKEALLATQIAYLNCIEKGEKNLVLDGKEGPFTVKELIMSTISTDDIKQSMEADGLDFDNETFQTMIKYSDLSQGDKNIIARLDEKILSWKIVDIHDTRAQNGFYGCVIETSEENAIVGIRGSEGLKDYPGLVYDWMESDFGLLNSEKTIQTEEVENYVKILAESDLLDKYDTISASGHSLGGNLASHFGIACAEDKNAEKIFNKLSAVYNFDGPGFSNEYIEKHQAAVEKGSRKIIHFKWSPVGCLLYSVPGENEVFLKTRKYYGDGGFKEKIGYYTFGKHDTRSIIFDENGQAQRGKEGTLSKSLNELSVKLEQMPSVTNSAYSLAASTIEKTIYQKEDGKIGFKSPFEARATKNYTDTPTKYENIKEKCEELVNGVVEQVKDYTTNICDKLPSVQPNSRLASDVEYDR